MNSYVGIESVHITGLDMFSFVTIVSTVFALQIKFSKNSHLYLFYFHLRSSIATLNNVEKLAVGTPVSCLTVASTFPIMIQPAVMYVGKSSRRRDLVEVLRGIGRGRNVRV